jgi:hypothetical protein
LRRLPGPVEISHFIGKLRSPSRRSAVRSLVDGVVVILTLRTRGARPLFKALTGRSGVQDPDRSVEVADTVDAALGLIPASPTCLRRSVTLLRELQRLHLDGTLHVGVRTGAGGLEAHAWVQTGDVVVNDDPGVTGGYVELASGELETILPLLR